ncbi:MAG: hypothetical protein KKA19_06875, partial [Candidatus Margulisbacteria bacterium]|nr:hypothetical protein [Candidatus Margulisiibacteriota bacterium]
AEEILKANTENLKSSITENRGVFNGTEAANIQNRVAYLNNLQMVFFKTYGQQKNSRNTVHKELTQMGSPTTDNSAEETQKAYAALTNTALNFQFNTVREHIQAQNKIAQDKAQLEKAKYDILLQTLSGLFSGLGSATKSSALRGLTTLGQQLASSDGLGGQLIQLAIQDTDINIGRDRQSNYLGYSFNANPNNDLDKILAQNDPTQFNTLIYQDKAGNMAVAYDLISTKLEQINKTINISKALTELHKASAEIRNMIHAEMTNMGGAAYAGNSEEINDANTPHYFKQMQMLSNHLQELADTESAKSKALLKFDRTMYKSIALSAFTALGVGASLCNNDFGSNILNFQGVLGAGIDTYYAVTDMRDRELEQKMDKKDVTEDILKRKQQQQDLNNFQKLDKLEAELQAQILRMKSSVGDFGMTATDQKALAYAQALLEIIEEIRDNYLKINRETHRARRTIHSKLEGKGTWLDDLAYKIQSTNTEYVNSMQQEMANAKNELSAIQKQQSYDILSGVVTIANAGITASSALVNTFDSTYVDLSTAKDIMGEVKNLQSLVTAFVQVSMKSPLKQSVSAEQVQFKDYDYSMLRSSDVLALEAAELKTQNSQYNDVQSITSNIGQEISSGLQAALKSAELRSLDLAIINDIENILRKERLGILKEELDKAAKQLALAQKEMELNLQKVKAVQNPSLADLLNSIYTKLNTCLAQQDWTGAKKEISKLAGLNDTKEIAQLLTDSLKPLTEASAEHAQALAHYQDAEIRVEQEIILVKNSYQKFKKEITGLQAKETIVFDTIKKQKDNQ